IVTPSASDLIERGYAGGLARPGGNVTGFGSIEPSILGKMLQTLKEIAPNVAHVSMIYNPDSRLAAPYARAFASAAGPVDIEPIIAHIHNLGDIERAVAAAAAQPNGGIFVPLDVTMITFMHETIATIARHRLPAIYSERVFVTSGGLVSYGTDRVELYYCEGGLEMTLLRRQFMHLAAGGAALQAVSRIAPAQAYPTRPVRVIVPFAPAGDTDLVARLMGQWLSERLGQPFIIENRPGAGTNIGTEAVVRAPADGYTLL